MDLRRIASKLISSPKVIDITKEVVSKLAGAFKDKDDATDFLYSHVDLWISSSSDMSEYDTFEVGLDWTGHAFYTEIDDGEEIEIFIFTEATKNKMYKELEQQQLKRRFGP